MWGALNRCNAAGHGIVQRILGRSLRAATLPGALAFRDNRCVLHNPVNDDHG